MSSPNKRPRGLMKSKKAADGDDRAPKRQKKQGKEAAEAVAANSDVMMQDWDDLKELFENAFKVYEGENPTAAAPLLRGIIHECDRFIRHHENDPTTVYRGPSVLSLESDPSIAFATIYGTALYLMGTLVAQDASIVSMGEPVDAGDYFSAACKIFADAKTSEEEKGSKLALAAWTVWYEFMYGQAILAAAVETESESDDEDDEEEEEATSPIEKALQTAVSHFIAGTKSLPPPVPATTSAEECDSPELPRSKAFLEASTAVLSTIQQDDTPLSPEDIERWCLWIVGYLEDEVEGDASGKLMLCLSKCWLAIGSRCAEQWEEELEGQEDEDDGVWESELAKKARETLRKAETTLLKAERMVWMTRPTNDAELTVLKAEVDALLGETYLSLANLTQDEKAQEGLYKDAKRYGADVDALNSSDDGC